MKKNKEFTIEFVSSENVESSKLTWKIDGVNAGTGKSITKSIDDMGQHTVEVYYNNTKVSSGSFKVMM